MAKFFALLFAFQVISDLGEKRLCWSETPKVLCRQPNEQ